MENAAKRGNIIMVVSLRGLSLCCFHPRMAATRDSQPLPAFLSSLSTRSGEEACPADLLLVLDAVATACKSIAHEVRRAGLTSSMGLYQGDKGEQGVNAGGEKQKKLDVISVRP